ncbi:MAG TPA: hypothetical protein VHQ23_01295, partial [Ilumatobacteraceae bacterium]|nr:hypothetical protein [Ilumatobacteraceae bacterium]
EGLQTALGKVGKTLDGAQWEKYGIATHDAGGQARDVNDILLDSFDVLGKITNQTDRTKAGNALFGKGYAQLAPLIGKTRKEMEDYLGSVEDGQVITDSEAKKAEEFRLAQDNLKDALHEVTLKVGEQVASLAPLLDGLTQLVNLQEKAGFLPNPLSSLSGAIDDAKEAWRSFNGENEKAAETAADSAIALATTGAAAKEYATATDDGTSAMGDSIAAFAHQGLEADNTAKAIDAAKRHAQMFADDTKRGLDEVSGRWDALEGNISNENTWINLQQSFDDVKAKMVEAGDVGGKSGEEIEKGYRDAAIAVNDQKLAVIDYAKNVLGLPPEKVTDIVAHIDEDDLAGAEAILANLTRNRNADIFITSHGGAGYGPNGKPHAGGGKAGMTGGDFAGEYGVEMVTPGANVRNPAETGDIMNRAGGGTTINITVGAGVDGYKAGKQIADHLREYFARSGDDLFRTLRGN